LPQQAVQLASFFSFFYMSINSGSLISTFVTPILRKDVPCFDQETCYSLAFAIPAGLMIVSLSRSNTNDNTMISLCLFQEVNLDATYFSRVLDWKTHVPHE